MVSMAGCTVSARWRRATSASSTTSRSADPYPSTGGFTTVKASPMVVVAIAVECVFGVVVSVSGLGSGSAENVEGHGLYIDVVGIDGSSVFSS